MNRPDFTFRTLAALPAASFLTRDALSTLFSRGVTRPVIRDVYEPALFKSQEIGGWLGERIAANLDACPDTQGR